MMEIITSQGIPYVLFSDNASIFKSDEFEDFCAKLGICHKMSPPYHPATNGLAERYVQTFKRKLKAMLFEDPKHIERKVQDILFKYRVTPLANGKSPSELHLGRQLRTKLHLLQPQKTIPKEPRIGKVRMFKPGERVLSRNYVGNGKWRFATVLERLGRVNYQVRLARS